MRKQPISITETGDYQGYALPQRELGRRENVKPSLLNKLVRTGQVDSFVLGQKFRYITLESWRAFIERSRRGEARDPEAQQAAIAAYRASCQSVGAITAARARSGWGPTHGTKAVRGRKPRAAAQPVRSPRPPRASKNPPVVAQGDFNQS